LTGKAKKNSFPFNKIYLLKNIDSLTDGLTSLENRKRLQATRALFMTIERRQVKEALVLNKQNKEMHRLDKIQNSFIVYKVLFSLVELKEAERLHQEESLAQRQISTMNTTPGE
jgi:hypothetical protein